MKNGDLVYDSDGTTILYETKEITDKVPFEVMLNKLGEPDTVITVIVTAEDEVTENEYQVTIKRPYGIIKGKVKKMNNSLATQDENHEIVRLYNSDDVDTVIDWSQIVEGQSDKVHDNLITLKSKDTVVNSDGSYEIYVIPGKYVVLLDKAGYLDHIYTDITVNESDIKDLGEKELIPGDVDKSGVIELDDISLILNVYNINDTDPRYNIKYDLIEDTEISLEDISIVTNNAFKYRIIE